MPCVLWCCLLPDGIDNIVDSGVLGPYLKIRASLLVILLFAIVCLPLRVVHPYIERLEDEVTSKGPHSST